MIEFRFNQEDLEKLATKLCAISPANRVGVTQKAFRDVTLATEAQMKDNLAGKILHVRSGRFMSSIGSVVTEEGGDLVGIVGSGVRQGNRVPYANIHETGGVIKPKNGKYLCIPIRAGSPEAIRMGLWNKARGENKGSQKAPISFSSKIIRYIMVKQVTIPARHYMSITRDEIAPQVMDIMSARIEQEANKT